MKKRIPLLIAVALILLTLGISVGMKLLEKYSYSKEWADLNAWFGVESEDEAAVMLQDELLDIRAQVKNGRCYLDLDSVHTYLNDRFYEDAEGWLIYALPDDVVMTQIGSSEASSGYYGTGDGLLQEDAPLSYYNEDGVLYVLLDFVRQYTNFSYTLYPDPNRIQLDTQWEERQVAPIRKNTQVRVKGGIKSDILAQVSKGDTVTVLEPMENWTKVKTADSIIGYVENKRLGECTTETPQAVTDYQPPVYESLTRGYKINLVWHQVTSESANGKMQEAMRNAEGVNVISPTWYSLSDQQGGFTSLASSEYVAQAHQMGLEVWGLVDNLNPEIDTGAVLSALSTRSALIRALTAEAVDRGLDGINIDFESLPQSAGEGFTEFLRELSILCHANGLVLSVDNYVPRESSAHYNRAEQGVVADYVIIMGYDEHWGSGGVAGSVASIRFVEDGITATLEDVPAEKVINAVPFYTRIWKTTAGEVTSKAVGMDGAQAFLDEHGLTASWDETTCQRYAEFTDTDGSFYQVWLEDEDSLAVKLNIMQMNDLAGVAAWKLGLERDSVWPVLAAAGYTR